jgi:hypothetical protein
MVSFRYIIVNTLHKGNNKDDDDDDDNNSNNRFFMGISITCIINGNHRIAATLRTVDKLLASGTEL